MVGYSTKATVNVNTLKVPAIVTCLMRLHNFCVDHDSHHTPSALESDEVAIQRVASGRKNWRKNLKMLRIWLEF